MQVKQSTLVPTFVAVFRDFQTVSVWRAFFAGLVRVEGHHSTYAA